ncbi:MAG: helix-turn-helix transcriptional regulator [Clostridia bacterium]|nr:helix-turn-helix transcriptional regulator [Clostridia bacterium]
MVPVWSILDIISLNRHNCRLNTSNKSCYVLSCRIRGDSLFFVDGVQYTVQTGDILYIPYGASYRQWCVQEEVVCFHLEVYGELSDSIQVIRTENAKEICTLFQKAADLWRKKDANYEYRCLSLLYSILSLCGEELMVTGKYPSHAIRNAVDYLDAHIFDVDLTVANLCENVHISRSYFNRITKELYGCTPKTYINIQRIKKAKSLLCNGNYTNEEIARLCGFGDVKYFYVLFKKYTGMTTGEYRKEHRLR